MPRPAKPSLYQPKPGGVWHYRFTVAGKRARGSTGEGDRGAAQAVLATLWHEAHRAAGRPVSRGPAAQLGLADLAGLWLATLEDEAAGKRNPRYILRHEQAIKFATSRFTLASEVTDEAWQRTMRDLRAQPPRKAKGKRTIKPPTWRTLQVATYSLRMLMEFAHKMGAVPTVPVLTAPEARAIAREQAPRRALTETELRRVLAAMRANDDHRPERIWRTMAYSGLRRGELAKLTLRWLDVRAHVLHVPANAAKSGRAESIPLHPEAKRAILAEARERARENRREGKEPDPDVPVFGPSDIRRAWARALKRSGVDGHGLTVYHAARHTYGTLVARTSRGDVSAIMAAGRWRSLSIVERYVHASAERARAAVRRLK